MAARLIFCLLSATTTAFAEHVRTQPLDVYTLPFSDQQTRLVVDWGSQGDTIERDPQQVVEERRRLRAWLKSPEVIAHFKSLEKDLQAKALPVAQKQAAEWVDRFNTVGQTISLPTKDLQSLRRIPLPAWMNGIPGDMRPLVQVGIFDASNEAHIRWAVNQRTLRPEVHLFAVGWKSMRQFQELHLRHPTLSATTVTTVTGGPSAEDWIGHYGVSALPAFCRIDGSELVLEEGVSP